MAGVAGAKREREWWGRGEDETIKGGYGGVCTRRAGNPSVKEGVSNRL